ncbi:MAG: hypothetical protein ABI220_03580 [Candidatus Saccharimonadales bacterium]
MALHKKRIQDVISRSRGLFAKVNHSSYQAGRKEPAELISEMSPPTIVIQPAELLSSARQRRGIRELAKSLRRRGAK